MHDAALHDLQHHAAALRRLARDLVGAADADDVMQDAAIEILRAPPRWPGPLLAWLRQVVRNVAGKRRRADAVRRRHETAAASERSFESEGAATIDSLRELTEWVAALPEPYRSTLLARYVQDLPPSAIAQASGVPVRTVKTRLQRGLQLLRERGERSGGDWRGAMAAGFGFDGTHAMTTATAVTGVLAMATMKKFVAAAVVAVAALVVWREVAPGAAAPVAGGDAARPALPVVAQIAEAPPTPVPVSTAPREAVPAVPPPAVPPPAKARADEIVVHVTDAARAQPIVAFGVREHMSPEMNLMRRGPFPVLHGGEHVDGRLVLPASAFVDRNYVVEDAAGAYLPSRWFDARDAVERDGERVIEVRMTAPVEVRVKVVRERSGEAVAGTRVELIRPWIVPHAMMSHTMAAPSDRFRAQPNENAMMMNFIGGRALLLGDVITDTAGIAVLRVPPGEAFALRLTSTLHCTMVIEPWQVPAELRADVVLRVAAGATVKGRVTPAAALAALRAPAPSLPGQPPQAAQAYAIGVRFQREGTGEFRPAGTLGRTPVVLADDGSFEVGGLAAGTWRMFFRCALAREPRSPGLPAMPDMVDLELPNVVGLVEGELRVLDLDVSEWVPGTLHARLPLDDRLDASGSLVLMQIASIGPPLAQNSAMGVHAVPGETTEVRVPPARYVARWTRPQAIKGPLLLGEFEVQASTVTTVALSVEAELAQIRVCEADGVTPARGMLSLQRAGWLASVDIDASGSATFDAMPRSDVKATFHRWSAERPNGPFTDAIDLGTVRGDGKPIVLRLPKR